MHEFGLQLGQCLIRVQSERPFLPDKETAPFVVPIAGQTPDYAYHFCKVDAVAVPDDVECVKWGQWWIYNPGDNEVRIRVMDDSGIPYMRYEQVGQKEYRVEYIEAMEPYMSASRVALSFMALERRMLEQGGLILHASFVEYKGYGVLFSAPSGTGKTTQARLWEQYLPCEMINGDRALLMKKDGRFFAYGWPIAGSSEVSKATCVPIKAIVQLAQGTENSITVEKKAQRFAGLIPEVTVNRWDEASYQKALDKMEELVKEVPIIRYSCNMSKEAVRTLEAYLFGEDEVRT